MWFRPFLSINSKRIGFLFSKTKRDLYQILGVTRDASQSDIKKAYYKLAQVHHPDKNPESGSREKFTQINGAYQILSDQNKRRIYDQTGSSQGNPYEGFENQDIFNSFRGGMGGMGGMGGFQSIFQDLFGFQRQNSKSENLRQKIIVKVQLQFNQSVSGTKKSIKFKKKCVCSTCSGNKSKPGTQPQKCTSCQGTGYMSLRQGMMILRTTCNSCLGQGKKVVHPCITCQGTGIQLKESIQEIVFPKGIENQSFLRFKGKGHLNGELQLRVLVKKHPIITRVGLDAHSQSQISIIDAVLGCEIEIKTIYGQIKKIKIQPGCQSGQQFILQREGFYRAHTHNKGNHIVKIKIKVPDKITEREKNLYQQIKKINKKKEK